MHPLLTRAWGDVGRTSRDKFELKTFRGHIQAQQSTMIAPDKMLDL